MISYESVQYPATYATFAIDRRRIDEQETEKFIMIGLGDDMKSCKIVKIFVDRTSQIHHEL